MSKYIFDFNTNRIYRDNHEIFRSASPRYIKRLQKKVNELIYSYINDNREWIETTTTKKEGLTKLVHKNIRSGEPVITQTYDFIDNINTLDINIPDIDNAVHVLLKYLKHH